MKPGIRLNGKAKTAELRAKIVRKHIYLTKLEKTKDYWIPKVASAYINEDSRRNDSRSQARFRSCAGIYTRALVVKRVSLQIS
jgi:hypothetical protein